MESAREGVIITRFGQHADVEDLQTGNIHRCNLRRTIKSLVAGDTVIWRPGVGTLQGIAGVVEVVHERRSAFIRPDYFDGARLVAANIDQVVMVSAILPELSTNIIDRYLIAIEQVLLKPLIVINKIDFLYGENIEIVKNTLNVYKQIGYDVIMVSQRTGEGMVELMHYLSESTSIFVGQSGVGKSSLINTLLPEVNAATCKVSDNSGLGQHTTTTARLYHLPDGGNLIDSPGVRKFDLWHLESEHIAQGFVEFRNYLGGCKFRDCTHGDDPDCVIREAVEDGKISKVRFDSYHTIIDSMLKLKANRQFLRNKKI
ncbi:Ribosome small subunit-stimulated GTPase EngC [Candidatus Enterovibrio altilux]|uniref:Small ribosomal subunit biogenesis GTPase RsgA n=1 Tax=Candidatus Enterovibrio altilux TaxID=1927128 RepID=A0A291B9C1_9GAMM|nr:Ribosome small subunit-stimulated GTPase EngC [Candidatus Enterovibrio luxaltus]